MTNLQCDDCVEDFMGAFTGGEFLDRQSPVKVLLPRRWGMMDLTTVDFGTASVLVADAQRLHIPVDDDFDAPLDYRLDDDEDTLDDELIDDDDDDDDFDDAGDDWDEDDDDDPADDIDDELI